jgi:hypothetical protein
MVEDGKSCNIGVKPLGIVKVPNPRFVYYGLDEDLEAALSGLVGLVVLE